MGVIAKQSIQGTIVTYLGVLVGFLTTFFVLTRFLTTEEIGLARVLIDAATLFVGLAQLGTSASIIRFYPYFHSTQNGKTNDHGFFFLTLIVPTIGFIVFALLFWALRTPLSAYFGEKSPLFVSYYYFVLPIALFMLYQTVFETNANVRMSIVVPRAVRELIVRIGLLVCYLLYAFRVISIDGFVVSFCVVYAVAALCNLIYLILLGDISWRVDWQFIRQNGALMRQYALYTLFLLLSALATILAPYLSSFILSAKEGLSTTGIFAIATYIAVMVSIPYRSLNAIASPELATAIKEANTQHISQLIKKVANTLLLTGTTILLLIWINIDLIFYILPNGEQYAVARNAVLVLMLSQLLLATFNIAVTALNYSKYYILSLIYSLLLTISAIMLNNSLIPIYGIDGAAAASTIAYIIYFALTILTLKICLHTTPLSKNMLITITIGIVVLLLNHLWLTYLPAMNLWFSSILRTLILLLPAAIVAYRTNVCPEINSQIRHYISQIRIK